MISKSFCKIGNYQDTFDNFIKDCQSLNLSIPDFSGVDMICSNDIDYKIVNNAQLSLDIIYKNFLTLCKNKNSDFILKKSEREKPKEKTFEEKRIDALNDLALICADARNKISKTSDPNKIGSWAVYKTCAEKYLSNSLSQTEKDFLLQEINLRGISGETLDIFVNKIMENSKKYLKAITIISGLEKKCENDLLSSNTEEQLKIALTRLKNNITSLLV